MVIFILKYFYNFILQDVPTVRLRLRKPKSSKKVQWTQGTVDNEHLNKKKSKCIYCFHI